MKMNGAARLIILGAGRPRDFGRQPGLRRLTEEYSNVLDWQLHTFNEYVRDVDFVGGYELDRIMERFPTLTFHYNREWQNSSAVSSLDIALNTLHEPQDLYITYSDILVKKSLLDRLVSHSNHALAYLVENYPAGRLKLLDDGSFPEHINAGEQVREIVGLLYVPASLLKEFKIAVRETIDAGPAGMSGLLRHCLDNRPDIKLVEIAADGRWAHMENSRSLAGFLFGSKAGLLQQLDGKLVHSRILPLVLFTRKEWESDRDVILAGVRSRLNNADAVIVRSSARNEDSRSQSQAGKYRSVLNVPLIDVALAPAVDEVFASYGNLQEEDEAFIQPMLEDVTCSGVIFTRTLGEGAPYYQVEYADDADTTLVTAGNSRKSELWFLSRKAVEEEVEHVPARLRSLIQASQEIETVVQSDQLDIEFGIQYQGGIVIFQVRPLVFSPALQDSAQDEKVYQLACRVTEFIRCLDVPIPGQVGAKTCWSVMADWNPAEIIGLKPFPLSFELYHYIISGDTWSRQRKECGYRDVTGWPLIRNLGGQAYVDIRASLNSFIPAELPDDAAGKVVDWSISHLTNNPSLHDKLEFEVIPTCLDFNFRKWRERFREKQVLNEQELDIYESCLQGITITTFRSCEAYLDAAREFDRSLPSTIGAYPDEISFNHLIALCRDNGALFFAHLARAAFVVIALLRSMVTSGIIERSRYHEILSSSTTVATDISEKASKVRGGQASREEFVKYIGHLRPGTYDINACTYRQRPELFIDPIIANARPKSRPTFEWTREEKDRINDGFSGLGLDLSADEFLDISRKAIWGREFSKFSFTKVISILLDRISEKAISLGIDKRLHPYLPLSLFLQDQLSVVDQQSFSEMTRRQSEERSDLHLICKKLKLPQMISSRQDIGAFRQISQSPNYITDGDCIGQLVKVLGQDFSDCNLDGKIIAIENADPGFDYLFSLNIIGLVTAYGGPNSHMAIRASEFGIPAIIGIGPDSFQSLKSGCTFRMDCRNATFQIVN